jgi:hypothetical protein
VKFKGVPVVLDDDTSDLYMLKVEDDKKGCVELDMQSLLEDEDLQHVDISTELSGLLIEARSELENIKQFTAGLKAYCAIQDAAITLGSPE